VVSFRQRDSTLSLRMDAVPAASCANRTASMAASATSPMASVAPAWATGVTDASEAVRHTSVACSSFREMISTPDPREHLRLQVAGSRLVKSRIAPIIEVIRAAAPADQDIDALWEKMQAEFHDNQRHTIRALRNKGPLCAGLSEDEATDVLYTLNHPTLYQMLVGHLGWSGERYQEWLTRTLIDQLLEPSTHQGRASTAG
jgi:hypothetical protein